MTGRTATFTFPMPPSVNGAYAEGADGRRHLTKASREWSKAASVQVRDECRAARFAPCAGQYRLDVQLSDLELTRDRDCDNTLKLLLDAIVKSGMAANDHHRHLRAVSVEWTDTVPAGMCRVTLTETATEPKSRPASESTRAGKVASTAVLAALRAKGISVDLSRVHVQGEPL